MSELPAVGILGVGTHLPPHVRGNDWWPAEVVARWTRQRLAEKARGGVADSPRASTPGRALVIRAMAEQTADPFQGAVERRVLADDLSAVDMEAAAAEDALGRAGIDRRDVDLLFTYTAVPDYLVNSTACVLHQRLGLSPTCLAVQLDATAFTFLVQLQLAESWITSGRAGCALLVQSCAMSRLVDRDDPYSPVFGDGAAAVVVGRVARGRGVIRSVNRTETSHPLMLVASPPGRRWYDEGRARLHSLDLPGARQVFLAIADQAKEVVDAVLEGTGIGHADVRFFASHQGTPWVRRVAQEYAGLAAARSVDMFPRTASLFAANIPVVLRTAEDEGLVSPGDPVLLFGGGTGVVYGATLLRWDGGE